MRSMSSLALNFKALREAVFLSEGQRVRQEFSIASRRDGSEIPSILAVYGRDDRGAMKRHATMKSKACEGRRQHPLLVSNVNVNLVRESGMYRYS